MIFHIIQFGLIVFLVKPATAQQNQSIFWNDELEKNAYYPGNPGWLKFRENAVNYSEEFFQ